jgi:hypothetical protein
MPALSTCCAHRRLDHLRTRLVPGYDLAVYRQQLFARYEYVGRHALRVQDHESGRPIAALQPDAALGALLRLEDGDHPVAAAFATPASALALAGRAFTTTAAAAAAAAAADATSRLNQGCGASTASEGSVPEG